MSLVMSMRFIFGGVWNDAHNVHHVFAVWQIIESLSNRCTMCVSIHTYSINSEKIFEYDVKIKYSEEYSTVDKVGREKLLALKSCFLYNWSPPHFFWSPSKLDSTLLSAFLFFCFWNPYRFISLPQGEAERFLKDNWQSAEDNCIWSLCFSRVFRALGYFNSSFNVLLKDRETKRVSYYLSKVPHVCYFWIHLFTVGGRKKWENLFSKQKRRFFSPLFDEYSIITIS